MFFEVRFLDFADNIHCHHFVQLCVVGHGSIRHFYAGAAMARGNLCYGYICCRRIDLRSDVEHSAIVAVNRFVVICFAGVLQVCPRGDDKVFVVDAKLMSCPELKRIPRVPLRPIRLEHMLEGLRQW